jgi:hypothetical protein
MRRRYRSGSQNRSHPMDFVYLAIGAAMFALFGIYAVLLRRV